MEDNVRKIKLTDNCRQPVTYKLRRKLLFATTLSRGYESSGNCLISIKIEDKALGIPVISRAFLCLMKLSEYSDNAR